MIKIVICMLTILYRPSQTQLYNCLSAMEILLHTQSRLIQHIESYENYITDNRKALIVKKFLSRCRREHERSQGGADRYLSNPINAFTLVMRLSRDAPYIEKILNETTIGNMKYTPDDILVYPSEEDMYGIVVGLTRLQILYDLDVRQMANGSLYSIYTSKKSSVEYACPMTSCDCFELGLVEYTKGDYSRNVAWMEEALRRFEHNADCPVNKLNILDRLSGDYYFLGDYEKSIYYLKKRIDASPGDPHNMQHKKALEALQILKKPNAGNSSKKPRSMDYGGFPAMCLKPYHSPNASLSCYYAHGPHPFLLLAPLKTERLHSSPPILLFRDVFTDAEALAVKALARSKFEQQPTPGGAGVASPAPFHQVAWIGDHALDAAARVAKRIAQFSGLVIAKGTAEDFQVTNYGTGGLYGPHYDFLRSNSSSIIGCSAECGVRIATALFYLSDVEEGGATVFTKLGVAVSPVKNAAVFWWNLDPSGQFDYQTLHAACPVLHGSRWAVTKWIWLSGQELVRPCPAPSNK